MFTFSNKILYSFKFSSIYFRIFLGFFIVKHYACRGPLYVFKLYYFFLGFFFLLYLSLIFVYKGLSCLITAVWVYFLLILLSVDFYLCDLEEFYIKEEEIYCFCWSPSFKLRIFGEKPLLWCLLLPEFKIVLVSWKKLACWVSFWSIDPSYFL